MYKNNITVREKQIVGSSFEVIVSINNGPEYDVVLPDPNNEKQEKEFEWYFGQHLLRPFIDRGKALAVAKTIEDYGEALFNSIFRKDFNLFSEYRTCLNDGLENLEFTIIGYSTDFHSIHWEALKAPELPEAFAAGRTNLYRKNTRPSAVEAVLKPSTVVKLLIVTARPDWEDDVNHRTIARPIIELIESARLRVEAHVLRPGTYRSLVEHLDEKGTGFYHIIHFDVHGSLLTYHNLIQGRTVNQFVMQARYGLYDIPAYEGKMAFLFFEDDEKGQSVPVRSDELANLLKARNVPVCLLNTCQSAKQERGEDRTSLGSELMKAGVQAVLGQSYSITVSAAQKLMATLYQNLFNNQPLTVAVSNGRRRLILDKARKAYFGQTIDLEDWILPVFYQNRPVQFALQPLTPEQEESYYKKRNNIYKPTKRPNYGFIGRDLDILTIEKKLLKHNMLLVRGMGGTGKSTLLEYLAEWWERTGFVKKAFYFGYDKHAYTLDKIIFDLAQQLFDTLTFSQFIVMPKIIQQGKIEDTLKTESYCLIFDNCESITGHSLAILNTLTEDEQRDLKDFLARLRQSKNSHTKTIVIFGSRSDESWIGTQTFGHQKHHLQGLDYEARTDLAYEVLRQSKVEKATNDPDFSKLMELLAGYPLAIEVILPNLRSKTVADLISDLYTGEITLDSVDSSDKTNSIIKCIEYSHSNLSADAQKILLFFAPFSSYFNELLFDNYTKALRQQPSFAEYPLDQWRSVLNEAVRWGLAESLSDGIMPILKLQPVFPYFLKQKASLQFTENERLDLDRAFQSIYSSFADYIYKRLVSNDSREADEGKYLMQFEYDNIYSALQISFAHYKSILSIFRCMLTYVDSTGDFELGLRLAKEVVEKLQNYPAQNQYNTYNDDLANCLGALGLQLWRNNHFFQSRKIYEEQLEMIEKSSTLSREQMWIGKGISYHQIGTISHQMLDFETALEHYKKALECFDKGKEFNEYQKTKFHIGIVFQDKGDFVSAKIYFKEVLVFHENNKNHYLQAGVFVQLGMIARDKGDFSKAKGLFFKALKIFSDFRDFHSEGKTYHHLGIMAAKQNRWIDAKEYYHTALTIFVDLKDEIFKKS